MRTPDRSSQPVVDAGGPARAITEAEPSAARERPILFSAPMVRAILDGRKTQTRRVVRPCQPPPGWDRPAHLMKDVWGWASDAHPDSLPWRQRSPYGVPGSRLWVRETWGVGNRPCPSQGWVDGIEYRADCVSDEAPPLYDIIPGHVEADSIRAGWRPSIHMPRWASRITLQITDVRVERLNEISEADARSEGFPIGGSYEPYDVPPIGSTTDWNNYGRASFSLYWSELNGPGSWDANPWVWAVSFERAAPGDREAVVPRDAQAPGEGSRDEPNTNTGDR